MNDDRIVIRPATAADLPSLGRLGRLLVETHHALDPARFMAATPHTANGYASFLATQLEEPSVIVLVAELGGSVIGYAYAAAEGRDYMALRGPAGVVHDIVVDPGARGRGTGKLLLDAAIEALEARGVPQIVLWTAARNEGARRLFSRTGFRQTMVEMTREVEPGNPG